MPSTLQNSIHTVLFATDLSDHSSVALGYAASIASAYRAKLFLVHVLDPSGATSPMDSSSSDLRELAEAARSDLNRISDSLLAAKGIKGEVLVRYGNVRDAIFQVQQECRADIVVLGSSGMKIGMGKGLGSTAEAILRSVPCSVLTVGPRVEPGPFSVRAQAILFPTDFSASSLAALPTATSLAISLSANLLLLHVCDPYGVSSCFGHEAACRKKLDEIASAIQKQAVPVKQFTRHGAIARNILLLAEKNNADFIVMGVHQGDLEDGTRLHGIVSAIVREARCPVLTVAQQQSLKPHLV
jgi:nucleotide-binding universal stress UspA family protein